MMKSHKNPLEALKNLLKENKVTLKEFSCLFDVKAPLTFIVEKGKDIHSEDDLTPYSFAAVEELSDARVVNIEGAIAIKKDINELTVSLFITIDSSEENEITDKGDC